MKISGEHLFDLPRERLYEGLLDPDILRGTLPGCEKLERTGDNEYAGRMKMKVGPVQGIFDGKVKLYDLDPPNGYKLDLNGQGAPGFVKGQGQLELEEQDGKTLLRYEIDAQVGGRIAAVGQRLIESSSKVIARQGMEGLERQLSAASESSDQADEASGGSDGPAVPPPTGPSQAQLAGEIARGVADDLFPPGAKRWLALAGVFGAAALVAILLRSCGR